MTKQRWVLLICCLLMPISGLCTDLYAPSLPYIAAYLHVPKASIGFSMTAYVMGLGLAQIPYGIASDVYGRRQPLLLGIVIYILACILILAWHSVPVLLIGRFFQGVGTAAISALTKSIIKDSFTGIKLKRNLSLLATAWGTGPIFGPVIGGYLQQFYSWQAAFVFLLVVGLLALSIVITKLPETHHDRHEPDPGRFAEHLRRLITCRAFVCSVLIMGLNYGLLLVFNVMGPFMIQGTLHYTAVDFGHMAMIVGIVFVASTYLNRYLLGRFEIAPILRFVSIYLVIVAVLMLVIAYALPMTLWSIMLPSLLVMGVVGILYPASMAYAMNIFPEIAGTAAAVMGTINLLTTAAVSAFASILPTTSMHAYAMFYLLLAGAVLFCVFLGAAKKAKKHYQRQALG